MWRHAALACMLGAGAVQAACPVLESRDWSAELVASETGNTLILRGTLDLPTPGYRLSWQEGPMDRALPPGWHLTLTATPPDGLVAQVVTPTRVEARFDTPVDRFRVIYIACGESLLAELTDIAAPD